MLKEQQCLDVALAIDFVHVDEEPVYVKVPVTVTLNIVVP